MKKRGSSRKSYPFIKVYLDIVKCAEFQKLLQIPVYGMQAAYLYIRLALYTTNNGGVLTTRIGEEEIDLSASDLVQIVNAAGADLATVNMLVSSLKQCHLLYQNSFGHLAVTGFCYTGDPAEPSLHNAERPDEVVRPLGNWMEGEGNCRRHPFDPGIFRSGSDDLWRNRGSDRLAAKDSD